MVYGNKTKVYKRLMVIVVIAIILCVVLCGGSIYMYIQPMVKDLLVEKNRSMILKMAEEVANSIEEVQLYADNVSFDETVQSCLRRKENLEEGTFKYYSNIQTLEKRLQEYKLLQDKLINGIFVVDLEGKALEVNYRYKPIAENPFFIEAAENLDRGVFLMIDPVQHYQVLSVQREVETVAYLTTIFDKEKIRKKIGTQVILLDKKKLTAPLEFDVNDVKIELHNASGEIVCTNLEERLEQNPDAGAYDTSMVGESGWYICYQIISRDITQSISRLNTMIMVIIGVIMAVMLFMFTSLVRRIVAPLDLLLNGVRKVAEGNRDEKLQISSNDECRMAADLFNSMLDSIEDSTTKLVESERRRYDTQLEMLAYQLNPHFIYNTLNAIICLARREDYGKIIRLTRAFMTILRSILQTNLREMVPLEEEITFINGYVQVLQLCYQNVPDVQWEIQDGLEELTLPRMILYPLVENSVFHGIIPGEDSSFLRISIREDGEWIRIQVEDDGIGCTDEQLAQIGERLETGSKEGHIGLYNVNARLRLIYTRVQTVQIENRREGGTRISFGFCPEIPDSDESIKKVKKV